MSDKRTIEPRRRTGGFQPAARLAAPHIRRAAEGRGIAVARILTDWPEVVGADLAGVCRPVRMTHGKGGFGGTLTLLVQGAQAPRVAMEVERIRLQVNACYGWNAVARITLTQTSGQGFAPPTPRRVAANPSPAARARAEAAGAGIEDPDLAAALARLALLYHSRRDAISKGSST